MIPEAIARISVLTIGPCDRPRGHTTALTPRPGRGGSQLRPLISDDAAVAYAKRYCIYGTKADVRRRMAELERAGVTTLITTPLAGDTAGTLPYEFIDSFSPAGLTS